MSDPGSWHDIRVQMVVMISQKLTHVPMKDEEEPKDETASDPEIFEEKKHRYMFWEKHGVSDEEFRQQLFDANMMGSIWRMTT